MGGGAARSGPDAGPVIATVGDNTIDRYVGDESARFAGGNAYNVAAQLAGHDRAVAYFGAVGADADGRTIARGLHRAGIDPVGLRHHGGAHGRHDDPRRRRRPRVRARGVRRHRRLLPERRPPRAPGERPVGARRDAAARRCAAREARRARPTAGRARPRSRREPGLRGRLRGSTGPGRRVRLGRRARRRARVGSLSPRGWRRHGRRDTRGRGRDRDRRQGMVRAAGDPRRGDRHDRRRRRVHRRLHFSAHRRRHDARGTRARARWAARRAATAAAGRSLARTDSAVAAESPPISTAHAATPRRDRADATPPRHAASA